MNDWHFKLNSKKQQQHKVEANNQWKAFTSTAEWLEAEVAS